MLKLTYTFKQKKRASTLVSLGLSEHEAADTLLDKTLYREAVVHMYFTCFYLTALPGSWGDFLLTGITQASITR